MIIIIEFEHLEGHPQKSPQGDNLRKKPIENRETFQNW